MTRRPVQRYHVRGLVSGHIIKHTHRHCSSSRSIYGRAQAVKVLFLHPRAATDWGEDGGGLERVHHVRGLESSASQAGQSIIQSVKRTAAVSGGSQCLEGGSYTVRRSAQFPPSTNSRSPAHLRRRRPCRARGPPWAAKGLCVVRPGNLSTHKSNQKAPLPPSLLLLHVTRLVTS